MNKRITLTWEIAGIFIISIAGSLMHFVYELSGRFTPLELIAAVNESTWEHLKLAVWPFLIFALVEHIFLKKKVKNFLIAKTAGVYLIPISIVVFFYSYLTILGHDSLFLDISIFIISIVIGQLISYKILISKKLTGIWNKIAILAMIVCIVKLFLFTFFPPHMFLFKDPVSGGYGIISR